MILRARPLYRAINASVGTAGAAFELRTTTARPVTTHQIVVEVTGRAFVGVGRDSSPPAATTENSDYQPAGERLYTFDGNREYERYLYVYAETGTVEARVSHFG